MRGTDGVDKQNPFPRVEMSNTRGCNFKVRGAKFKRDMQDKFFFSTQNNECMERTVHYHDGGKYDCEFQKLLDRQIGIAENGEILIMCRQIRVALRIMFDADIMGQKTCSYVVPFYILSSSSGWDSRP